MITLSKPNTITKKAIHFAYKHTTTLNCAFSIALGITLTNLANTSHAAPTNEQLTQVYKTIDTDGSVSFSDTPTDNAQSIQVKPITTVPAFSSVKKEKVEPSSYSNTSTGQSEYSYEVFSFIQPANNSSFHSASGTVQVALKLEPELQSNNKIKILLDGSPVALKQSLTHTLTNIDRGTHILTAQVLSHDNTILESTGTSFTLHRPSIKK